MHYYTSLFKKLEFNAFDINAAYYRFLGLGYIRSIARYETSSYFGSSNEFEISEVKIKGVNGFHFIATKEQEILYDSLDLKPRGKEFKVTLKRIFKFR